MPPMWLQRLWCRLIPEYLFDGWTWDEVIPIMDEFGPEWLWGEIND